MAWLILSQPPSDSLRIYTNSGLGKILLHGQLQLEPCAVMAQIHSFKEFHWSNVESRRRKAMLIIHIHGLKYMGSVSLALCAVQ